MRIGDGRTMAAGLLGLMLVFGAAGCAPVDMTDTGLRARIVGTWYKRADPAVPQSTYFEKDYRPNGTTAAFFAFAGDHDHPQVTFTGKWRIDSGRLYSTVLQSSDPRFCPEGPVTPDVVESIGRHKMVLIETDDGERQVRWRK